MEQDGGVFLKHLQLGDWPEGQGSRWGAAGVWRSLGTYGACGRGYFSSPPHAGIQRFCRDIHMMLGFKPGLYFRACWLFLSPATLLVMGVGIWGRGRRGSRG